MDSSPLGAPRPAPRSTTPVRRSTLVPRALVTALVATLAALGVAAGSPASATASDTTTLSAAYPAMAPGTYEKRVQYWINRKRRHHGLHRVRLAACTDRVAERWGRYLAVNDEFYHQSMDRIMYRCDAYYAGETLARGSVSPRRVVTLWMHSPDHRHVLLSPRPRRIGVGAFPDVLGRWVVAADFMHF